VPIIRCNYVRLRGEEKSNSINTIYISILFLLGIGFCLYFPSFLEYVSGISLYNSTDSNYFIYLDEIRKICANCFLYLLIYFCIFLQYRLNLSISSLNKSILTSTIIIKGGFEGLGDTEMDERPTEPTRTFLEIINSKDCLNSHVSNNPEVKDVSVPYPPETSNANKAKPSTESSSTSGYPSWPWTTPALNLSTLPESNSEPDHTTEGNNKKVRINGVIDLKEITETGLGQNSQEVIDLEAKDKLKGPKKDYDYNPERPSNWQKNYPEVNEENRPEIVIVYPKLSAEEIKYKSAYSKPETNIENSQGEINNPSASLKSANYIKNTIKK